MSDSQYRVKKQIQSLPTSLCCWSLPAVVGSRAAIVALLWTPPMAFSAAAVTWATNLCSLYSTSIGPLLQLQKQSLQKISLHKWRKCINALNLHLFQENIQNWQLRKTKTRAEFHLQGYFSAVSPSLQTPNSRAWKGLNKFPSDIVIHLSAWKPQRVGGESEDTCFI